MVPRPKKYDSDHVESDLSSLRPKPRQQRRRRGQGMMARQRSANSDPFWSELREAVPG